nr:hypothetical protein [Tanacetum cinerariifolium]
RVDSFEDKESLGDDASKQERKIHDIDVNKDITLVNDQDDADDAKMFDVSDLHGEEVFVEKELTDKEVSVAGEVNVASIATTVSVASTITTEEVTLAKALAELKALKPKVKGVFIQELSESITTTTTISSKKSQDKGKAIMVEEPVKLKKKDQIRLDEEAALKLQAELQAEFDEEQRLAREKAQKELEVNIALIETWDDKLFDRAFKRINTFVDFRTQLVEGRSKRVGEELTHERSKKQKVDDDNETAKLKKLIEIIPNKEEVAIDAIPLVVKSLNIVDWKINKEENKSYYQIIRADGNSNMYLVFNRMLKEFDREDLEDLYSLIKASLREDCRIKSHLKDVGITAAHIDVNTALRS